MKNLLFLTLLLLVACNPQVDTTELNNMKEKLTAAEKALSKANVDETAFIHTVFFWMKKGVTEEEKADFVKNGLGKLAKAPTIYKVYYGPPAMSDRDVVDDSFDVAWVCHFKSKEDQDAYQIEPIHLKFVEDYQHLWDKVKVYDNLLHE